MRALVLLLCSFLCIDYSISSKCASTVIHPAVGEVAPEIILKNPLGDSIRLSDLRGNIVLVDFWASWCRTCRVENHHIRQAYLKYKNRAFSAAEGFTILSISLDNDSLRWTKAIRNDRLDWVNQVSDFQKWESPVVKAYNFTSLPHNLLVDSSGTILAKGLFGGELDKELSKLIGK